MRVSSRAISTFLTLGAALIPAAAQTTGVNSYIQTNLVSNATGGAPVVDPNLIDPWGISFSTSSPFWVSNHLSGTATVYNGAGTKMSTVVKIPAGSASAAGALGRPTGQVQNSLSTAGAPVPGAVYTFQTLNNSGDAAFNQLLGINNAGVIAGYFGDGTVQPNQGYTLVPPSTYTNENYPQSAQTQVIGINNAEPGEPVATVGFYIDASGNNFGFVAQNGKFTQVNNPNTPAASSTSTTTNQLLGVNDNDVAVGFYVDGNGNSQGYQYNFSGSAPTFTPITLPASFNAMSTIAAGINDAGAIAGVFTDTSGNGHGFYISGGTYTQLDNPNGTDTAAFGLNNVGQIVGSYVDANGVTQGFIYAIASQTWQEISDPKASATAAFGANGTLVNGINDYGSLVGFYSDGANVNGFLATTPGETPVPFLLPPPNEKTASFIFATDDGTISAWNGSVVASTAVITVDNSAKKAVYKGLAIGTSANGPTLYGANFRSGKIDVFNSVWAPATLAGTFTDPSVPAGFAPFNITSLGGKLYVTYAKQDSNQYLDVAGAGNGYVAAFDFNGNLLTHLISGGALNSPWGVAIAPANWGAFGGALLVGNFGDGKINAFNATSGALLGTLMNASGTPIVNAGLWALIFGNGKSGGDINTLYFSAGVPDGSNAMVGLLGSIAPPAAIQAIVNAASQMSLPVAPGELVEITGQTVGPSPSVSATIPPSTSALATTLGTTSVTVNGTAAPILYANGSQTNIQIPYEVAGSTTASVVLTTGGQTTPAFTVQVRPVSPGIFTTNFTGSGQAVALNADGTVNSSTNAAARGSMITIFATGEGVTTPATADGMTETGTGFVPAAQVSVVFNTTSGTVTSASSTPHDVAGVLEVQVSIPTGIPAGQTAVALSVGGVSTENIFSSVQNVYVFVK
ncbi:MAG: TIGR03118 family protein [Bryobacteraceae bacterium]